MTVHRGVLRHGRSTDNLKPQLTNLGRDGQGHGEVRYGYEAQDAFATWLWHLDNGRIQTGKR